MGAAEDDRTTRPVSIDPKRSGPKDRVLVIDDDPLSALAIERALSRGGFTVCRETDPVTASHLLVMDRFAAIVTDINMPSLSGVDLLAIARSYDPHVPVILVTGAASIDSAIEAANLGSTQYLLKPLSTETLIEAVRRAVAGRPARDGDETGELGAAFERAVNASWIAFQPIVQGPLGRLQGYEALVRSDEPSMNNPKALFEAAEALGKTDILSRCIRRLAAEEFGRAPSGISLFVNVHSLDLADSDLFDPKAPLSRIASRVVLELTEREALDRVADLSDRLRSLRKLGFRIAVDDLGAGYAGLASFALVEPDVVKIDMGLVRGAHKSVVKQRVIGSVMSLAKDSGVQTVAEGIETPEERDCLLRLGADGLQGYLFGRPSRGLPDIVGG
jgi:EAL domain-containing protein (putative c-di-GMP-specific phosphodiesterase class I)